MNAHATSSQLANAQVVNLSPASAETAAPKLQDAAAPATAEAAAPKKKSGGLKLGLLISIPLLLAVGGGYYWLTGGRYEATDNANVQQAIVSLSADISGRITEVDVKENQLATAGDVLFRIDPAPYRIAFDQANASLASARLSVEQLRVNYTTAEAKLAAARQALVIQQRTQGRNTDLANRGVATAASADAALLALQQAQSAVDLDQHGVASAIAALGGDPNVKTGDTPSVKSALASVETARRNLDKTVVVAPATGIISAISSLNVGQFVATGTTIASIVATGDTWVEANFKETQLGALKDGQPADVTVDAYPGVTLHGAIDGIGAATGAQFSLIPAQNATGNWVKVVQRVPVRIKVTTTPDMPLRTGMSASVTIDTGKSRLDAMH
jgi:membrane fusion protein (multidrug efflux system)